MLKRRSQNEFLYNLKDKFVASPFELKKILSGIALSFFSQIIEQVELFDAV